MKLKDIAKRGLKGRKKDTLLINLVITLSFIFIITATIFQSSIEKTKKEQSYDLYGQWHGAYLGGDEETLEKLKQEEDIDKLGVSLIIGKSDDAGVVGTFNQDLVDMGRLSLYKGTYPQADNEIMLELNQMTNMNLDLEVGQKINVAISIDRVQQGYKDYILGLNKEFYESNDLIKEINQELKTLYTELEKAEEVITSNMEEEKIKEEKINEIVTKIKEVRYYLSYLGPKYYQHHETPFEDYNGVTVVVSNKHFYYYMDGDEVSPEIIREKGLLTSSKVVLKKEFIVTGILDSYSDKWDIGDFKTPNAFITEEGGEIFKSAFYENTIGNFSEYEMDYNMFLYSEEYKENTYNILKEKYPNVNKVIKDDETEEFAVEGFYFWINMFGMNDEEIERALESTQSWTVGRRLQDWRDISLENPKNIEAQQVINLDNFRRNTFSYPPNDNSMEYVLSIAIIAVIFVATALAIFQIFLTQMKRRSRKIVLLRSIGTTKMQIIKILFHEGIYLLKNGLLFGVPLGILSSVAVVYGMNIFGGRNLYYHIIPKLLILGIVSGCLSVFVGMAVPMIFAIRIPLVGTMSKPPKHKKFKHKEYNLNEMPRKSFVDLNWDYFKLNKGKTLISFGISFITITIILATVFLCYSSFDKYREVVIHKNRPDYALETFYGEHTRRIGLTEKELIEIKGIKSMETYKVGKQTLLWHEEIDNNPLILNFEKLLPSKLLDSHFAKYNDGLKEKEEYIKNALYTKTYGIDPSSDLFKKYYNSISEGNLDKKKFESGEEIILLVPLYDQLENTNIIRPYDDKTVLDATNEDDRMSWLMKNAKVYDLTYDKRYKDYYNRENTIKVGDKIILSSDLEALGEGNISSVFNTHEVTVGGIIYYFAEDQIWPFSNHTSPYAVVASYNGMESVYPSSRYGIANMGLKTVKSMVDSMMPTKFGRTLIYLESNSKESDVVLDSKLLSFANSNAYTLYNYKESNAKLYQEGFNNALIIGLLGFTSSAIACIILYNILVSKLEQDKNRIGILQSLGVTKQEFTKHYISIGIINGLISTVLINIVLFVALIITSWVDLGGTGVSLLDIITDIFTYNLWLYPWLAHIGLSILFVLLTIFMYYLPSRKITNAYPVENIRSLGR